MMVKGARNSTVWFYPCSRDVPLYQFCNFLNIVQNAFDPLPLPLRFEHLVDFFDGLRGTLHCPKIGHNKA